MMFLKIFPDDIENPFENSTPLNNRVIKSMMYFMLSFVLLLIAKIIICPFYTIKWYWNGDTVYILGQKDLINYSSLNQFNKTDNKH